MKILNKMKFFIVLLFIVLVQFVFIPSLGGIQAYSNPATVPLGTVSNFAALAHTGVSSPTGGTVLNNGDLGIDAGCTEFPFPCTTPGTNGTVINGAIQNANGVASTGQGDATIAVNNIGGRSSNATLLPQLGGQVLTQGVYDVPFAATNLTGSLTLNGDANSVFIFRMADSLITDNGSSVILGPGVQACNVFWKVYSSATFNGTTTMVGTVLASASVTFPGGGATLSGRAIAQTAAITFNNTTVNNSSCAAAAGSSSTSSSSSSSSSSSNSTPVCVDTAPTNNPDLFQIDRAGSTAVLHFTPVSGNISYYYVAYGLSPGSEQYGVSFPASSSTGAMSFTINDLNPNLTYYFKIRGGYGCAPGGWSNNKESNSKNPSLPNTGFAPRENNNIPLYILAGILVLSPFLLKLIKELHPLK